ncbi:MAG: DUF2283 domain-containing protein [bacterium]
MIYDPESNILSWEVSQGKINHAREIGNFIFHLSDAGQPVLIEVLDASKFIGQFDKIKNIKELIKQKSNGEPENLPIT